MIVSRRSAGDVIMTNGQGESSGLNRQLTAPRRRRDSSASWRLSDRLGLAVAWALGLLFCAITAAIVIYLLIEGLKYVSPHLLVTHPTAGFTEVQFVPHGDHPSLYRDTTAVYLRLHFGRDDLELPAWALEVIDSFDAAMNLQAKRELMLEGSIVLTKG